MSKGLEALKRIALKDFIFNDDSSLNDIKIIKQELEALEIIKDKVDIHWQEILKLWLKNKLINQEEYDLLKEVLL